MTSIVRVSQTFDGHNDLPGSTAGFRSPSRHRGDPAERQRVNCSCCRGTSRSTPTAGAKLARAGANLSVRLRSPECAVCENRARRRGRDGAVATVRLRVSGRPCGRSVSAAAGDRSHASRQELDVVPGFEAVRLPLDERCMPTGLAWRGDGTLVVSSLEGRVWLATDTDGDGLEDRCEPFSDDLAAPYGVAVHGDAVDVINKYALLRLHDDDGDGFAERTEQRRVRLGAHGRLSRLGRGAGARSRGQLLRCPAVRAGRSLGSGGGAARPRRCGWCPASRRATTRGGTRLRRSAAGCGFRRGWRGRASGELFATDNQGNYNPFNELNHIVSGARYGFINRLEAKRGPEAAVRRRRRSRFRIPGRAASTASAFWKRRRTAATSSAELFGPLAGQLVGCEYDTRRLVRMSLERVGGQFQGAVYPFSREPTAGEDDVRRSGVLRRSRRAASCTSATFATAAGAPAPTPARSCGMRRQRRIAGRHRRSAGQQVGLHDRVRGAGRPGLAADIAQLCHLVLSPHLDAHVRRAGRRSPRGKDSRPDGFARWPASRRSSWPSCAKDSCTNSTCASWPPIRCSFPTRPTTRCAGNHNPHPPSPLVGEGQRAQHAG